MIGANQLRLIQRSRQSSLEGLGLDAVVQRVLEGRGAAADQLDLRLAQLLQPDLLGLPAAVNLLMQAYQKQQSVVICGDFDADGATSTALMIRGLRRLGFQQLRYHVPDRFRMGYGLSVMLIEHVRSQGPVDLIITVDNGMSSSEAVAVAQQYGIRVLITDHHLPGEQLPAAEALVNPNQPGCPFPAKNLAGVGVAFYLLASFRSQLQRDYPQQTWPGITDLLDLVALGTVADLVPLDSLNRILVHQGLCRIRQGRCVPGILALAEASARPLAELKAADLGFYLAPRLNAAGRLDHMALGIECLLTDDLTTARQWAARLHTLNQERRHIEEGMKEQALLVTEALETASEPRAVVLFHEQWHEGVIGLVASRIKEKTQCPVIALAPTEDPQVLKGSARSIAGAHMRDLLAWVNLRYPGTLLRFGGHAMAAGLSMQRNQLPQLRQGFLEAVAACVPENCFRREYYHDGELTLQELRIELAEALERAGPWGQGFPEPRFIGDFVIVGQRLLKDRYLKLTVDVQGKRFDAICFNPDLNLWPDPQVSRARMGYALEINNYKGQAQLQLRIDYLLPLP